MPILIGLFLSVPDLSSYQYWFPSKYFRVLRSFSDDAPRMKKACFSSMSTTFCGVAFVSGAHLSWMWWQRLTSFLLLVSAEQRLIKCARKGMSFKVMCAMTALRALQLVNGMDTQWPRFLWLISPDKRVWCTGSSGLPAHGSANHFSEGIIEQARGFAQRPSTWLQLQRAITSPVCLGSER